MDTILYQRIRELCAENHISMAQLERNLNYSHSYLNKLNGTITPTIGSIEKLATYFDVSVDYLIGRSDVRNVQKQESADGDAFESNLDESNKDIRSFQRAYEKSDPIRRKEMMQVLRISFKEEFKEDDEP